MIFKKLLYRNTPRELRQAWLLNLSLYLSSAAEVLSIQWHNWLNNQLYLSQFTGQVAYLELVINEYLLLPSGTIYISDGNAGSTNFLPTLSESDLSIFRLSQKTNPFT